MNFDSNFKRLLKGVDIEATGKAGDAQSVFIRAALNALEITLIEGEEPKEAFCAARGHIFECLNDVDTDAPAEPKGGKPGYMSQREFESWERGDITRIGEYTIKPKKDFGQVGFHLDGEYVKCGWVVIKDHCLAAPGAVWAQTHDGAKMQVGALMAAKGDADIFHGLMMMFNNYEGEV